MGQTRLEVAALFDGIAFENGELRAGDIPAANSVMQLAPVRLQDRVMSLQPGEDMVMSLRLEGPAADPLAVATLLQFEGTSSHVRVEADEPAA